MRLIFPLALAALALHSIGCASYSLTPGGEMVYVVAPLSISEVGQYEDLGELQCNQYCGEYAEEYCLKTLRNAAAERGAYAIAVTSKKPENCSLDQNNTQHFVMKAHAYRKKP